MGREIREILRVNRLQRLFAAAQRYALSVRGGGCVWPNHQALLAGAWRTTSGSSIHTKSMEPPIGRLPVMITAVMEAAA